MKTWIKQTPGSAHSPADLFGNDKTGQANLQLAFIATLFVTCWVAGYIRMGEVFDASHGVSIVGTLIGM
ncbi:hypothetical protein [Pseudomonas sp. N040]|uniref:hypothetical protein n=1 Tax=Pseudomonas sp. N040 TaxID=2785325 RepID=UPI0018A30EC0|nr:hypothetical protein [Pseudomonas sp. N040]MBF7731237.1 hypothetical protein [Pseudomonas sp. N040]MBW7014880.1 hypothetical protein [Pseudomonas sp. N040]